MSSSGVFPGRGGEALSVKDYGARGDGITDDTAAVAAAVAACGAAGGGTAFFPAGTYPLTASVSIPTRVQLAGAGADSIIKATGTQTSAFSVVGRTGVSISDLTTDANNSAQLSYSVYVSGGTRTGFNRCTFINQAKAGSTAIMLDGAANQVNISGCNFITSGARGVSMINGTNHVTIDGCTFDSLREYGTYGVSSAATQLSDITISNNRLSNIVGGTPREPIYFTGGGLGNYALRVKILNNTVLGNKANYSGGVGNGDMVACYDLSDSIVSGNVVLYGGDVGISVWRSRRVTITGNVAGYNNTNGIVLWQATSCTVSGNVCYNNRQDYGAEFGATIKGGIRAMTAADSCTIVGNRCYDDQTTKTQDYGVAIDATGGAPTSILVATNHLAGNLTGGISDAGTGTVASGNVLA